MSDTPDDIMRLSAVDRATANFISSEGTKGVHKNEQQDFIDFADKIFKYIKNGKE